MDSVPSASRNGSRTKVRSPMMAQKAAAELLSHFRVVRSNAIQEMETSNLTCSRKKKVEKEHWGPTGSSLIWPSAGGCFRFRSHAISSIESDLGTMELRSCMNLLRDPGSVNDVL